jgi:DNA-binding NarL/FixJ family response regulator
MTEAIRIIIVEDHSLFRHTLRTIIDSQPDMEVVAEAENGLEAIKQVQKFKPDIVLMDIRMPVMDGIDATRQIISNFPGVKIVALSSHSDGISIEKMLHAGAMVYLTKICSRDELIECLYDVRANDAAPRGKS